jgi:hypothetical protein
VTWDGPGESTITFDDLVAPLGRRAFAAERQGTREWVGHGDHARFDALLSWRALDALIRDQRPSGHRFRLLRRGVRLPEETYQRNVPTLRGPLRQIDPARLMARLRDGATLVWDAIDQCHPPVRALKQEVERALEAFAFVNVYASWGTASGTNDHWDDHEIFVLQVLGRKRWSVHPPTRPSPLPDDDPGTPPTTYLRDVTLTPGNVLYLPRGWWHLVTPLDEPSLHLTVGVLRPTNADLLQWILGLARESELIRRDLPPLADEHARAAHAAALRQTLDDWIRPEYLELFIRMQDATHYLDPRPTLQSVGDPHPDEWDPDAHVSLLSTRARVDDRTGGIALLVAGDEYLAPEASRPLLDALVGGRAVRVGTMLESVPAALVTRLVEAGVVAII